MRIGIDIDDTLTETSNLLEEYAFKYGHNYSSENYICDNMDKLLRGVFDDDVLKNFFKDYAEEVACKVKLKENASNVIEKLKKDGHQIYFITARSEKYFSDPKRITETYLESNNIFYDKLITSKSHKTETCIEEKIDVMFDDAIDTCEHLIENGIKGVVFNSRINEARNTSCDRINTWNELLEYVNNI